MINPTSETPASRRQTSPLQNGSHCTETDRDPGGTRKTLERHAEEASDLIDTSKMSAGPARRPRTDRGGARTARTRQFRQPPVHGQVAISPASFPFPEQSAEDRDQGDAFLNELETFLREHVDPDEIDRTGEIPQEVIDGLAEMGAFGIKISPEYGGLGLSQTNYRRAAMLLGS